jgi:leucyl/phenylalanyl-tRNA--protein transferase
MAIRSFPPVEHAAPNGLLAVGGDSEPESLLLAYRSGIFPWQGDPLMWFAPKRRAVLFLDEFRISKSLRKAMKQSPLTIQMNTRFREVMERCRDAVNRRGLQGSWITPQILSGYTALFEAGHAYSVEAFHNNRLVGGLYGVRIGAMFSAESMFYEEPNASKICLAHLVEYVREAGSTWIDCQAVNDFTASIGVKEIPRRQFMQLLKSALL